MIEMNVARLRKVVNRKSKKTGLPFYRYDLTIPNDIIIKLGWGKGFELTLDIKKDSLVLKPNKSIKE